MAGHKPVCVKCGLFFKPKKNGAVWEEGAPIFGTQMKDGRPVDQEAWRGYKLWQGDLWECRECGAQIIVGTGFSPLSLSHEPRYKSIKASSPPLLRVNDC